MKKIAGFLTIIILAGSLFACKKIIKKIFTGFDTTVPGVTVTLPPIPIAPPTELDLGTFQQDFNLDSIVKANTGGVYSPGDISSIKVRKIVFTLDNPDAQNNIANFQSARFTFYSSSKSTPVEIASVTFPDTYGTTFTSTPTDPAELKDYLSGNKLYYHIYGQMRRVTTKSLNLTVVVTITVR